MEQPTLSSATNPLIDALVLQHLQKRFPQSAECLQRELASRDAAAAAPPPTNRHALLMLLAPPGDETPLWATAYAEVRDWVDGALDTEGARYKPELSRLLWPLFAYTYLELLRAGAREQAGGFFASFHADHALMRRDELNQLSQVSSAEQVDASEFARRLLTSRYEVRLSAFSRALLLGFVAERRLQLTLRMLNERIKLALPETLAPSDGGGPAAVALEDDVHGGALLWSQLDDALLADKFSEPVDWSPPADLEATHAELLRQIKARQGHAVEEEAPEGKKRGRGKAGSSKAAEAAAAKMNRPSVPLPPPNMRVEKEVVRDGTRCAKLSREALPCALAVTLHDGARLCCASLSRDASAVACGHADSAVRVLLLKSPAAKKQKAAGGAAGNAGNAAGGAAGGAAGSGKLMLTGPGAGSSAGGAVVAPSSSGGSSAVPPGSTRLVPRRREARHDLPKPEWHAPWKLMRVISGHLGWVRCVAVDPTNQWYATGSADRTIKVWDLASGTLKLTLTGHISTIRGLAVSDRSPYLFSAGEDKMVRCWDLEYNRVIRDYHGHLSGVYSLSLHPTLDLLCTGGRDSVVRVWDIRTKANVHTLTGHNQTVVGLATQALEPQVISGSMDSTIRLWDLVAGRASAVLTNHKKAVRSLLVHPTEYTFCSASADNLKKWKCPEGKFLHNITGHNSIINALAINQDNVMVAGGDNGKLHLYDWKTGYNFQTPETVAQPGSLESERGIYCAAFDQSGSRLITGEADKTVKIWKEDPEATAETHPVNYDPPRERKRY